MLVINWHSEHKLNAKIGSFSTDRTAWNSRGYILYTK